MSNESIDGEILLKRWLIGVFFFCILFSARLALSADSDKKAYGTALTRLLQISCQQSNEEQVQRLNEARQAFWQFADDYPQSIYADDSRFVYSLVEFMGALMVPPRDIDDADGMIALMDQTIHAYPQGKIEELTYSILRQELGDQSVGGAFYIPYNRIVEYMQALKASQTRDYKNAVKRYSFLKEALGPITNESIAMEIYVPLYIAYIHCGKGPDAQALLDEVSGAYPGSGLESTLQSAAAAEKIKKIKVDK